jgi:5-methylcytosine-specific restriction endonuclease McrA
MSARVSLSMPRKQAERFKAALFQVRWDGRLGPDYERLWLLLEAALSPKPKKVAAAKAKRAVKASRRASKAEETAEIYGAVRLRAAGRCEACDLPFSTFNPGEMDHFFGRGKVPQAISNCWLICHLCHSQKTLSLPDATKWLDRFETHARFYRYVAEARRAGSRRDALALSRESAEVGRGGR